MTGYPQRDKFFALRFCRLLTKRCLAQETGSLGTWLLTVIVHQEDAAHYRRGVTFYDGQLMPLLGINSKKSMTATRKKLIESGWLHFEPGHKGKASIYWVLVPREAEGLDDLPTDEGLEGFGSQKEPHSTDSVPFGNLKGHISGTERGALLPNPNPNPHHPVVDDPLTRKKPCQGILKQLTGYTAEVTSRAWEIACQFAKLNPGRRSIETAAKIVSRFAGCISNHGPAAATRIETYFSLVDPAAWQAEVDAGILLHDLRKHNEARIEFEAACSVLKKLVADFPSLPEYRRIFALFQHSLGSLFHDMGQQKEARTEYESARDLQIKLVTEFPTIPQYRVTLVHTHKSLGRLFKELGNMDEARREYEAVGNLMKKLIAEFPEISDYRQTLVDSHASLGQLFRDLGNLDNARVEFETAIDMEKKLVAEFPNVPAYRHNLAGIHQSMGILFGNLEKHDEARVEFEAARDLNKKLVAEFPAVPAYKEGLVQSHNSLGLRLSRMGEQNEARFEYEAALDLQKKLAAEFPASPIYQSALANTKNNLGLLLKDLGKLAEAEEQYLDSLKINEKLVNAFPSELKRQVNLGGAYCNFGNLLRHEGKHTESLEWLDKAVIILDSIHKKQSRYITAKEFLCNSYCERALTYEKLEKYDEAMKDWDKALEVSSETRKPSVRTDRAISRIRAGHNDPGIAEINELIKTATTDSKLWYSFACAYAVASSTANAKKSEHATRAVELLKKAVALGYKNTVQLAKDKDLDLLRDREDFKKLIAEMEKKSLPKAK